MKIGMLSDTFMPVTGGAEIHVLEISRALRELGHEVGICTAVSGPGEWEGLPVTRLPGLTGGDLSSLARLIPQLPALQRFIRSVDVVHAHYSFQLAAAGALLAPRLGRRLVVTLHGLGTLDSSVRRSPLRRWYRRYSLSRADAVVATSGEMADVASRYAGRGRITVISNGVDTRRFAPRPAAPQEDGAGPVVLAMRRLVPKNGIQYLIEAAPYVLEQSPGVRFWIAGQDRLEPYLRQRVQALGIGEQVRFIGLVPHEQTPEMFARADIVAFPSSAESTSLACLEAMAVGKAVVASKLSAFQEMLGDDERGLLVSLFDRQTSDYDAPLTLDEAAHRRLAGAIVRLAQDEALRARLGQCAREYAVEHYDWRRIVERLLPLYRSAGGV